MDQADHAQQLYLTRQQVRSFDAWVINILGIPGAVLMENAGRSCAEFAMQCLADVAGTRVFILCGTGNNGGDGFVIARHMFNRGASTVVALVGDRRKVQSDARTNMEVLDKLEVPVHEVDPSEEGAAGRIVDMASGADLVVDALLGTGLAGKVRPHFATIINTINGLGRPVLAVDIPSGLDCDTGLPLPTAVKAAWTVTFVAAKTGFTNPHSSAYTGRVSVASIGVEPPACKKLL